MVLVWERGVRHIEFDLCPLDFAGGVLPPARSQASARPDHTEMSDHIPDYAA